MANQRFDFGAATTLQRKLVTDMHKVEGELNQMMRSVEGVREWWSGGSEEAFIQNFRSTKDKMVKSLNQCIEDYQKLVQSISDAKIESDRSIADQLKV